MLRYFYIITLLQCIEVTFSYNYIENDLALQSHKLGRHSKKLRKADKVRGRQKLLREDFDFNRSPLQFDLAGFIQPEDDSIDNDSYKNRNSKRPNKLRDLDYGTIIGLNINPDSQMKHMDTDYPNIDSNHMPEFIGDSLLMKDSLSMQDPLISKHPKMNDLEKVHTKYGNEKHIDVLNDNKFRNSLNQHHPEKKCALRHVKFPFFSHNKTESRNTKKKQKRKLFCFNSPKRKNETKVPELQYKMKRSNVERLCPACKKKYFELPPTSRKKKAKREFTSKEQSYNKLLKKLIKMKEDLELIPKHNDTLSEMERIKREESIKEKYIRILEDVHRKIDDVPANVSHFIRTQLDHNGL